MPRRRYVDEPQSEQRWLVSYADFITLMFALFVVMYSVSSVNDGKYRVLSDSLEQIFSTIDPGLLPDGVGDGLTHTEMGVFENSKSPLDGHALEAALGELEKAINEPAPGAESAVQNLENLNERLQELSERDDVRVRNLGDRIEVELDNNLLFASGQARIQPAGIEMLRTLSSALIGAPVLRVEGHTDDRPVGNLRFASNWELSAARAASVVDVLATIGIAPERMAALGYGEFRPVADNGTKEGRERNRRVIIVAGMDDAMFSTGAIPASVSAKEKPEAAGGPEYGPTSAEEAALMKFQRVLELPGPRILQ